MSDYHEKNVFERHRERCLQRFKDSSSDSSDSSDKEFDDEDFKRQTDEINLWKTSINLPNKYKDLPEVKGKVWLFSRINVKYSGILCHQRNG